MDRTANQVLCASQRKSDHDERGGLFATEVGPAGARITMRVRKLTILIASAVGVVLATWLAAGQQTRRIDDGALKNAGKTGEEWLSYGLTPSETRYSPLKQIDVSNVSRLGLAWSYDVGTGGGPQEATPLIWNGTIYGITNWSI